MTRPAPQPPHAHDAAARWSGAWTTQTQGTVWERTIPELNAYHRDAWDRRIAAGCLGPVFVVVFACVALLMSVALTVAQALAVIVTLLMLVIAAALLEHARRHSASAWARARDTVRRAFYAAAARSGRPWAVWRWCLCPSTQRAVQPVELRWDGARSLLVWSEDGPPQPATQAVHRDRALAVSRSRFSDNPQHPTRAVPPAPLPTLARSGQLVLEGGHVAVDATHDPDDPSVLTLQLRQTEAPYDALVVAFDADVCDTHPWLLAARDRAEPLQRDALTLAPDDQRAFLDAVLPHLQASGAALPADSAAERVAVTVPAHRSPKAL